VLSLLWWDTATISRHCPSELTSFNCSRSAYTEITRQSGLQHSSSRSGLATTCYLLNVLISAAYNLCELSNNYLMWLVCCLLHLPGPPSPTRSTKSATTNGHIHVCPPTPSSPMLVFCVTVCEPCMVPGPCVASRNDLMAATGVDFNYRL